MGGNGGVARKSLNLFFRDAFYNWYLRKEHGLENIAGYLEVPLDSLVGKRLKAEPEGTHLPRWESVKSLKTATSDRFQTVASEVAMRLNTYRVHLDVVYWRGME